MKYQKREKMYEVNVWDLKKFVLEVANFYQLKQLQTAILLTCCLDELQELIKSSPSFHRMILKQLIHYIDCETEAYNIEKHLVYMKLLLNWNDHFYQTYRHSLMQKLKNMVSPYLTSDLYVVMRHLIERPLFTKNNFIQTFDMMDDEIQKYFLCEIYLIEEDYKIAYTYLKDCRYVGVLQEYDYELRNYSLYKYHKYALKESLFKINPLGDQVWMRNQLKY